MSLPPISNAAGLSSLPPTSSSPAPAPALAPSSANYVAPTVDPNASLATSHTVIAIPTTPSPVGSASSEKSSQSQPRGSNSDGVGILPPANDPHDPLNDGAVLPAPAADAPRDRATTSHQIATTLNSTPGFLTTLERLADAANRVSTFTTQTWLTIPSYDASATLGSLQFIHMTSAYVFETIGQYINKFAEFFNTNVVGGSKENFVGGANYYARSLFESGSKMYHDPNANGITKFFGAAFCLVGAVGSIGASLGQIVTSSVLTTLRFVLGLIGAALVFGVVFGLAAGAVAIAVPLLTAAVGVVAVGGAAILVLAAIYGLVRFVVLPTIYLALKLAKAVVVDGIGGGLSAAGRGIYNLINGPYAWQKQRAVASLDRYDQLKLLSSSVDEGQFNKLAKKIQKQLFDKICREDMEIENAAILGIGLGTRLSSWFMDGLSLGGKNFTPKSWEKQYLEKLKDVTTDTDTAVDTYFPNSDDFEKTPLKERFELAKSEATNNRLEARDYNKLQELCGVVDSANSHLGND